MMKNRKGKRIKLLLFSVVAVAIIIGIVCRYNYHKTRYVEFELHSKIAIANMQFITNGFVYIDSVGELVCFANNFRDSNVEAVFSECDLSTFDFACYDYLIFFQRKLLQLQYSPKLMKEHDGEYYRKDGQMPLIHSIDSIASQDTIYIYKVENTDGKFREVVG
jgi:hypothetical protein